MARENFYPGTNSSLEPGSDNLYTGASIGAGRIGGTTSIQSANQITEVSNLLNSGMKAAEVSTINADVFEMIPRQHLREINRLTKLTGTQVSLHAPMIEPSGFTQQGWSEQNRELAERQFKQIIQRAYELSPDRPIPVTIHSSAIPGTETMPIEAINKNLLNDDERHLKVIPTQIIAVNRDTGQLVPMRREEKYELGEGKRIWTPQDHIASANNTEWINKLTNLEFYKKEADESMPKTIKDDPMRANLFLRNVETSFNSFYDNAYRFGSSEVKEALNEVSKDWRTFAEEMHKGGVTQEEVLARKSKLLSNSIHRLVEVQGDFRAKASRGETEEELFKLYEPVEQFAIDKASDTFSNVAVESWKQFKEQTPIISIENPPYGTAISTAEELKELIEVTRKKFSEKLARDQSMDQDKAEEIAKKVIGATWDTAHISMIRKQGYKAEELIKQAEIIAPFVKHVHLNDNLGYTHTDLPPGMGDVPFKDIIPLLKEKGSKDKKFIFEGGNFFQHFKSSPHPLVLEGMGSPLYTALAQPSWNQVYGTMGTYSSGYGPFLPEQHFSTYGAGFSGLPTELGGQVSGKQSRLSGAPMT